MENNFKRSSIIYRTYVLYSLLLITTAQVHEVPGYSVEHIFRPNNQSKEIKEITNYSQSDTMKSNPSNTTSESQFSSSNATLSVELLKRISSTNNSVLAIHDYTQFHANDSFIGKYIPCTYDEKVCLRQNKILDPDKRVCLENLFEEGNVNSPNKLCKIDRQEFAYRSGHLKSICTKYMSFEDHYNELPCEGLRMAHDGKCYSYDTIRDVICGCDAPPTRHIFGGYECRCSPPTPVEVQQPEEDRLCRIPDFRFPKEPSLHTLLSYNILMNCSAAQRRCFSEGKVWMPQGQDCFSPFTRGPCPSEHVVGLNEEAANSGFAEGICHHIRGGCPVGQRRISFDKQCYTERDFKVENLQSLDQNIFGMYSILNIPARRDHVLKLSSNNICHYITPVAASVAFFPALPRPACPQTDTGKNVCSYYESSVPNPKDA